LYIYTFSLKMIFYWRKKTNDRARVKIVFIKKAIAIGLKMKRKAGDAFEAGHTDDDDDYHDDDHDDYERPLQVQKAPPRHPPTEFWQQLQSKISYNNSYNDQDNNQ